MEDGEERKTSGVMSTAKLPDVYYEMSLNYERMQLHIHMP